MSRVPQADQSGALRRDQCGSKRFDSHLDSCPSAAAGGFRRPLIAASLNAGGMAVRGMNARHKAVTCNSQSVIARIAA